MENTQSTEITKDENTMGRPPLPTPKVSYCVRLTKEMAEKIKKLDRTKSLSKGIEILVNDKLGD